MNNLLLLLKGDKGQGMTEYGLILAVFIVAVIVGLMTMGTKVTGLFAKFNSEFP